MSWTFTILAIIGIILAYVAGILNGINHGLDNLKILGSIQIVYDTDGEKYMALRINPDKKDAIDDNKVEYAILRLERQHIFEERTNSK